MVRINKIYTKTGDRGQTHLVGGEETSKDSTRVEAYGTIDELSSFLGWSRTIAADAEETELAEQIGRIQNTLFDLGSEVASPAGAPPKEELRLTHEHTEQLEEWIDALVAEVPPLTSFVLPGGSELNAALHIARTCCRRAERRIVTLSQNESLNPNILTFLNRLSDYLFAAARATIHRQGQAEYLWQVGGGMKGPAKS